MATLRVDTSDLLRFAKELADKEKTTKTVIARALNQVGEGTAREVRQHLEREGFLSEAARRMVRITPATNRRLEFEIAVDAMTADARTLPVRDFRQRGKGEFREGELVRVVNMPDDKVCPVCREIAANSPYTVEEAQQLLPHGGPLGANECRCILMPWVSRRTLPVQSERRFAGRGSSGVVDERLTIRQLAERVATDLGGAMRIKVR